MAGIILASRKFCPHIAYLSEIFLETTATKIFKSN